MIDPAGIVSVTPGLTIVVVSRINTLPESEPRSRSWVILRMPVLEPVISANELVSDT